jgi:hypothetical protein
MTGILSTKIDDAEDTRKGRFSETGDNETERATSLKLFAVRITNMAVSTGLESPSSNGDGCATRRRLDDGWLQREI